MAFLSTNTWSPGDEILSAQMNDLDSKTVQSVDGVGGGSYAGALSFTNIQQLDIKSGLNLKSGSVMTAEGNTDINLQFNSLLTAEAGCGVQFLDGAFVDVRSDISYKSTHQGLYDVGSLVSISGTQVFNSGSTQTLASGSTLNANAGSTVTLAGLNTISGASNRLKLTPRSVTRKLNLTKARFGLMYFGGTIVQSPSYSQTQDFVVLNLDTTVSGSDVQTVSFPIEVPHNSTLTSVLVNIDGSSSAVMSMTLYKNATVIQNIPSATTGVNTFTVSEVIDNGVQSYRVVLFASSTSTPGVLKTARINSIFTTCTVPEYDEG